MLRKHVFRMVVTVVLFSACGRALAQQEQWLGYKTAAQPYYYIGSTYGQRLGVTDKAPEGVKLPELKDDKPVFVKWDTPMSKQPAWFMLVRSHNKGLYDTLYVDTNLDGSLADETPIKANDTTCYNDYSRSEFNDVKVSLPGEDGPVAYALKTNYQGRGKKFYFYLDPGCWYEGWVTIDGMKYWCVLIDNDANGRFGDVSSKKAKCDKIRISTTKKFAPRSEADGTRFLGKYVAAGGKLYCVDIAPDGAYVKFKPAGEVPHGTVQCDKFIDNLEFTGECGNFIKTPVNGELKLPAGAYSIDEFYITRTDDSGVKWKINGRYRKKKITVEADKTVSLGGVEPFIAKVTAIKNGPEYRINLDLKTSDGGTFTVTKNNSRPPAPKIQIRNADGSYDKAFHLEYG